jgi:bis(5'-nucleosyl)-tetraphosphatase (symmetrical)
MATWAIGDVQGCAAELERLLELIAFDPRRDRLWFVGDLVNRGPGSLEVLRRVQALGEAAIVVLGNHDLHLLAIAAGAGKGGDRLREADASLAAVLAAPDRSALLDWLRARPMLHHDPALRVTMIHAGLPPQWDLATALACAHELEDALRGERSGELFAHMYGDGPDLWDPGLAGYERLRFTTNCLTRLRVVDGEGRLRLKFKGELEKLPAGLVPWFRAAGRRTRDQRLVCGHWSALGYRDEEGVLALDTGCVWGGSLTAQRIDGADTRVSVPSIDGGLPIGLD